MNHYQKQIAKYTQENPAHVEAWMRTTVGTLDHLSSREFHAEVTLAAESVRQAGTKMSQDLADSMGIK